MSDSNQFTDPAGQPVDPRAEASSRLSPGTMLNGRYRIDREIGAGGFGTVYEARDERLSNRRVAVKALSLESTRDAWRLKKFQQEMEALARLDHPGIITVFDTGLTPDGAPFLVMQFVEGQSLRAALKAGSFALPRAVSVIRQMGQALESAHAGGVLHRDLKPENIMLQRTAAGEDLVKLIDFGIASLYEPGTNPTATGVVAGSIGYMAPEQYEGKATQATDVYAFGMVVYEILTGRFPFSRESAGGILMEQFRGLRTLPSTLRHGLPEGIDEEISRALSSLPAERQQTAGALADNLVHALSSGEPTVDTLTADAGPPRRVSGSGSRSGLEIGHVLFVEIAGYAQLPIDQQSIASRDLQNIVRSSPTFVRAGPSVEQIPFGEGMALVFSGDPVSAVECAMETARAAAGIPGLMLRTGIHSGPVSRDASIHSSIVGSGIHLARRLVEAADAGHILLSKNVAEVLLEISGWRDLLADLGVRTMRDGTRLHLYNLYTGEIGNSAAPSGLPGETPVQAGTLSRRRLAVIAGGTLLAATGGTLLYRRWFSGSSINAVAVFPFARQQADDLDYLADGIAEELIDRLARLPDLRVTAFSAVSRYRGDPSNLPQVANTFGVEAVLTGRMTKKGEALIVNAELVGVRDKRRVWGKRVEVRAAASPGIAGEMSSELATTLRGSPAADPVPVYTPSSAAAHRLYLQGRYFWNKRSVESIRKSIEYFHQAIDADPLYPLAYCGIADAYSTLGGVLPPGEAFPKAKAYVRKAMDLAPNLPDAHASAGLIELLYEWNWPATERAFRRALELNPNHTLSRLMYSRYLAAMGRFDEAIEQLERARLLDPVDLTIGNNLGNVLLLAGRYDLAARELRKALEMDTSFMPARVNLGSVYAAQGKYDGAIQELSAAVAKLPQNAGALSELARAYWLAGRQAESRQAVQRLDDLAAKQYVPPYFLAVSRIGAAPEEALQKLERGYEERYWAMIYLKVDARFNPLRTDARYQALLKKLGLS